MDNIEEERNEIKAFVKEFDPRLLDYLEFGDKPDSVIRSQGIGIEHTRIFQPNLDEENNVQHQEALMDEIVKESKSKFSEEYNYPTVDVHIIFETNYWINIPQDRFDKKEVARLSEEIPLFVYKNLPAKGNTFEAEILECDELPDGVASITIHHYPTNEFNDWKRAKGGMIPFINKNYIQKIINIKNQKIDGYKDNCNEYWLLIVSSDFKYERNIKILKNAFEKRYQSTFDRVFLFFIKVSGLSICELKLN